MDASIQIPSPRRREVQRDLALLLLAVILCSAPFLSQPFHMDDSFYMDMARNAQEKPFYPNDTPYIFEGRFLQDMGSHSHPPLQTYFLALLQRLFGEEEGVEWIYHTAAVFFPLLAVISFYFLAARYVARPIWPAAALAVCPVFLVMSHTLMTDVPNLAFWLAALASFLWAAELARSILYLPGSLFLFLAMFTSYQSVVLAPLLGFYLFRKRARASGWLALGAPLMLMGGWFFLNFLHYGRILLVDTVGYVQSRNALGWAELGTKLVALLEYQGWLLLFPVLLLYVLARDLRGRGFLLCTLGAVYLSQLVVPEYRIQDKAIFVTGLVAGLFISFRMVPHSVKTLVRTEGERDDDTAATQLLGLWYLSGVAICLLIFTEGSARYILPLAPAVILFFFQSLERAEITEYRRESRRLLNSAMVASGTLVLSLAFGMILAHADLQFARVYPRTAYETARYVGGQETYYGGEWGFRYYHRRSGVRQLPLDESEIRGGDYIVRPKLALPYNLPDALESMTSEVKTLTFDVATPVRLLDRKTPAGFYSTGWGLIPFSFSRDPLEVAEIAQVQFLVERLPWATLSGTAALAPWPGYMEAEGRRNISLLLKPGSELSYPWDRERPVRLVLECAVSSKQLQEGVDELFEFEVLQRDHEGKVLERAILALRPGSQDLDRGWRGLEILLRPCVNGEGVLELRYRGSGAAMATGAVAQAEFREP